MHVVVLCPEPDGTLADPGSAAAILQELGFRVTQARLDLGDLAAAAAARHPSTVVLVEAGDDIGRAQQVIKRLRHGVHLADAPIVLAVTVPRLSAIDFSIGFSDFVLMPLVPAELHARLRQLDWKNAAFGSDEVLKVDELIIDLAGYEARLAGRRIEVTHREFEGLRFRSVHRGRVFTRAQLLDRVWGCQYGGGTRTVDIHGRRLRAKLGTAGDRTETVRNVGYKMRG